MNSKSYHNMVELMRSLVGRIYEVVGKQAVAPRRVAHLPVSVSLVEARKRVSGPLRPPTLQGHARDISTTGIGLVLPAIHLDGSYFTGVDRKLCVVLDLATGPVKLYASPVRYEPLNECECERGYLIGAHITEMSDDDRANLLKHLSAIEAEQHGERKPPLTGAAYQPQLPPALAHAGSNGTGSPLSLVAAPKVQTEKTATAQTFTSTEETQLPQPTPLTIPAAHAPIKADTNLIEHLWAEEAARRIAVEEMTRQQASLIGEPASQPTGATKESAVAEDKAAINFAATPESLSPQGSNEQSSNKIETTYNDFKDLTTYTLKPMRLEADGPGQLELSAVYNHNGEAAADSDVMLLLRANSQRSIFVDNQLCAVIDGEQVSFGTMNYDVGFNQRGVQESLSLSISLKALRQLARARSVEMFIGAVKFSLDHHHLQGIRNLVKNIKLLKVRNSFQTA